MDIDKCNSLCAPLGYAYFGVQMGGTGCFCGNSFGSQGKTGIDSACNVTCIGNKHQVCGGPNLNSVYAVVTLL
jgi:hypothetical protein